MTFRRVLSVGAVALIAACTDPAGPGLTVDTHLTGNFRVINAFSGPVNVLVDGTPLITNLAAHGGATGVNVSNGQHTIALQAVGAAALGGQLVTFGAANFTATLVAGTASGQLTGNLLLDTNAIVPAGATKLRVGNFTATAGPISIWRTQPDWGTPIRVQFPFPSNTMSPYMQSTPGDWKVLVSHEDNTSADVPMPDTLAASNPIAVAGGQSRTVIITDGATAGTFSIVVIDP